jgi:multidrug resistance efflux pump
MQPKRVPIPVIVLICLLVFVGVFFGVRALLTKPSTALTASGSIETTEVTISPELGGKVAEVLVDEGASIKAGDPLFRLDDALLQAQRSVAAANLDLASAAAETAKRAQDVAESNWTLALNAARLESAASRTSNWRETNPSDYTLPGGYFSGNEQMLAASAAVDAARSARDTAQAKLNDLRAEPTNANFFAAETRLEDALASFLVDQDILTRANLSTNSDLRDSAQATYDAAKTDLKDAQAAYDTLKGDEAAKAIISARADLAAAQEGYESAQDRFLALQIGVDSPKVAAAQAVLNQAVEAANQAQKGVAQAQASLALLEVQIAKLTVKAPSDGVILTRSIQPGEVIPAGAAAFTLGRLDELTLTVYIPEDRYGEIQLGQAVSVTVDSFPGETFSAIVSHIADQAEYTPRNVQTVSGRKSTVFAIKLQVQDPSGRLKPGMPADVTFSK